MKVINPDLLREVSDRASRCELCGALLRQRAHAHHVWSRGAGRLDIPINLIALGGPWDCQCHQRIHDGKIPKDDVVGVVARRESVSPESIELAIFALRRADKAEDWEDVQAQWLDYT